MLTIYVDRYYQSNFKRSSNNIRLFLVLYSLFVDYSNKKLSKILISNFYKSILFICPPLKLSSVKFFSIYIITLTSLDIYIYCDTEMQNNTARKFHNYFISMKIFIILFRILKWERKSNSESSLPFYICKMSYLFWILRCYTVV